VLLCTCHSNILSVPQKSCFNPWRILYADLLTENVGLWEQNAVIVRGRNFYFRTFTKFKDHEILSQRYSVRRLNIIYISLTTVHRNKVTHELSRWQRHTHTHTHTHTHIHTHTYTHTHTHTRIHTHTYTHTHTHTCFVKYCNKSWKNICLRRGNNWVGYENDRHATLFVLELVTTVILQHHS
jgi:hypothetical protein